MMKIILAIIITTLLTIPASAWEYQFKRPWLTKCVSGANVNEACIAKYGGSKAKAHILKRDGGINAFTAHMFAKSLNRRGVTVVAMGRCDSSCAIIWNLAKRKCYVGEAPRFRQHAKINTGERVNHKSTSGMYWRKLGIKNGPDPIQTDEWTEYTVSAKYRCSNAQLAMTSTDGNEMAKKYDRNRDFRLGVRRSSNGVSSRFHGAYGRRTPGMFK